MGQIKKRHFIILNGIHSGQKCLVWVIFGWKPVHFKERDEACLSFRANIFTKSLRKGGVPGFQPKNTHPKYFCPKCIITNLHDIVHLSFLFDPF